MLHLSSVYLKPKNAPSAQKSFFYKSVWLLTAWTVHKESYSTFKWVTFIPTRIKNLVQIHCSRVELIIYITEKGHWSAMGCSKSHIDVMVRFPQTASHSVGSSSTVQLVSPSLRVRGRLASRLFSVLALSWWKELPNSWDTGSLVGHLKTTRSP